MAEPTAGLRRGFTPGRASLVVYVMAGYPDRETSLASVRAAASAGADVIEMGVPYSDPLADGPVIAGAGRAAIAAAGGRFGLAETLELAAAFAADPGVDTVPPVALMTYFNPMLRLGLAEVARRAADAGVAGFIVPDLPPGTPMADAWLAAARPVGLDAVFLVAPTSTDDRIALAVRSSTWFVYCVSSVGITGERERLANGLPALVERIRAAAGGTPVAVGFGIATPEQATEAGRLADGVVVGSAVVRRQADPGEVGSFVRSLRDALDADA